jgi:hypothetical protein
MAKKKIMDLVIKPTPARDTTNVRTSNVLMNKTNGKKSVKTFNTLSSSTSNSGTSTYGMKKTKQVSTPSGYKERNKSLFMINEPNKKSKLQIAKTGSGISPKYRTIEGAKAENKFSRVLKRTNVKNK